MEHGRPAEREGGERPRGIGTRWARVVEGGGGGGGRRSEAGGGGLPSRLSALERRRAEPIRVQDACSKDALMVAHFHLIFGRMIASG